MHHRVPPPNWVAKFKRGDFSTCSEPRPGRPKKVNTRGVIDQIHQLILEDRRISAKLIAEQLGISRERVGSIIHEDLDMRKLSAKWVQKILNADQKVNGTSDLSDPNDFLSRMLTMDETWLYYYDRRQSNNQWSGSTAAHPALKYSECKNRLEVFSPRFLGIKTASFTLNIFQRSKLSTRSIIYLCWYKWRTATKGVLFLHDNAPAHRALATQKKVAYLAFQCLDHPTYFPDLAPSDYHLCSGLKNNWKFAIFHPTRRSMLPRRPG